MKSGYTAKHFSNNDCLGEENQVAVISNISFNNQVNIYYYPANYFDNKRSKTGDIFITAIIRLKPKANEKTN